MTPRALEGEDQTLSGRGWDISSAKEEALSVERCLRRPGFLQGWCKGESFQQHLKVLDYGVTRTFCLSW